MYNYVRDHIMATQKKLIQKKEQRKRKHCRELLEYSEKGTHYTDLCTVQANE